MTRYLVLLTIFFFGCGQTRTNNSINETSGLDNENTTDTTVLDYDGHQYFNDIKPYSSDSLLKIISTSDKVYAYNWNEEDRNPANVHHYLVDAYGVFDDRIGKKIELSKKEITKLTKLLADTSNFSNDLGICFIPHIAFVYYLKDSVVGQTNVCFLCAGQKSFPKTRNEAFSDVGFKRFSEFCKSLGLSLVLRQDN